MDPGWLRENSQKKLPNRILVLYGYHMEQNGQYVIGVDGGGTGCRVRLEDAQGRILAETRGGPANITSDFDTGFANILGAVNSAYEAAGLDPARHAGDVAWMGLAGAATGDNAAHLVARLGFARARITTDCTTTTEGALGPQDGLVAMLGTGSFFVRRTAGKDRRIGGWGYQLGDEAGGAWLGRALLARTLHAHDGLLAHSPLTRALLARHGSPDAIVAFAQTATPGEIATLAREIANADADAAAQAILAKAVALITARLDALGGPGPLCLLGGLAHIYAPRLPETWRARLIPARGDALSGAISLARHHLLSEVANEHS